MKKERIISLMLALTATAMTVRAQEPVRIISSNFPDANFREIVKGNDIDKNQDGWLETGELAAVTTLTVRSKSIESLKGVEHFYKLMSLICDDNRLSSLDVSKITTLKALYCSQNRLTSLDVSKNTALTILYCYSNKLTSLDLSNNKALTALTCYLNRIGHSDMLKLVNSLPTVTNGNFCGISISSSTEKNVLAKSRVEIAQGKGWSVKAKDGSSNVDYEGSEDPGIAINATNFPDENFRTVVAETDIDTNSDGKLSEEEIAAVMGLDISEKNIASLKGIEFFTALTDLYCDGNQLTSLDVSKNTALKYLYCENNQLTSLDVSKNSALIQLDCHNNQLKSLDTNNPALQYLYCKNNQLTSLDVSKNTALKYLYCYNNQIKDDKMQALVNSLPTVTEGDFWVIDTKSSNEQNVCTRDQVVIAMGKGWTVFDNNGGAPEVLGQIAIDATNFPDENFRTIVAGTDIDTNSDGKLSEEEIAAVTWLDVNEKNIASLKGIEFFTALTELHCGATHLTSLNVSKNTALTFLDCSLNQLTSLDVSKNTALTQLDCSGNQLTSLDVSKNTALQLLGCLNNQIKGDQMQALVNSLPTVTGGEFWVIDTKSSNEQNVCTEPQVKIATGKGWTVYDWNGGSAQEYTGSEVTGIAINATNFPDEKFRTVVAGSDIDKDANGYLSDEEIAAVTQLTVSQKNIASLKGIEFFTALTELVCYVNELTSLDVSKNTALKYLSCHGNYLTTLDVSKNTALTYLNCDGNELTSLDVSKNTALEYLNCWNNQLTSLDVSKNTALYYLDCSYNELTSLDVSKNTALKYLSCRYENQLTSLDVSKNTALIKLYCDYNQLTSLDVSKNTALKYLSCPANQLTSLDVSKNTALEVLECNNNQLTSLDVNKNTALKELYCYNNELTTLDVSKNTALTALVCYGNQLTTLDVSKNTALQLLGCFGNQIKGEQMQALVNSLPTVTEGDFWVIDTKSSYEQNVCTKDQVAIAKGKGWTVYDYNGGSRQEYAGSVVTAIRSIEVSAEENGLWYSLDGKRLSGKPAQKGIYIHNGKKVVIK